METKEIIFDIETQGLEPMSDKISCISTIEVESGKIDSLSCNDEKAILTFFWNKIDNHELKKIYSYNGDSFDLPFIIKRSLINEIPIPMHYHFIQNVDLRKVVNAFFTSYNKNESGKLSDWARILGIKVETESGKEMVERYYLGKFDEIQKHCEEDVKITLALLQRCIKTGVILK